MLIRRSVLAGCETTEPGVKYFHRLGREKIVPSVDARSLNGIFEFFVVKSCSFCSSHSSGLRSFHECPIRKERRFSIRSALSNNEQMESGLKIWSEHDWTSLVERFSFGNFVKTRQKRQASRNTPHTCGRKLLTASFFSPRKRLPVHCSRGPRSHGSRRTIFPGIDAVLPRA